MCSDMLEEEEDEEYSSSSDDETNSDNSFEDDDEDDGREGDNVMRELPINDKLVIGRQRRT